MPGLVTSVDLSPFPGAPFDDSVVLSAGATIRNLCGWHIAPTLTETVTVNSDGGHDLFVDSRMLTSVTAARDVSGDTPVILTGFRWSTAGRVWRDVCWPRGFQVVELDIVHGYDRCPDDLLPLVADAAREIGRNRQVRQESAGGVSVSWDGSGMVGDPVLGRYRIPVV